MAPVKSKSNRNELLKKVYQTRIDSAYKVDKPLSLVDQTLINHPDGYSVKFTRSSDVDENIFKWMVGLTKRNMENLYNSCVWGWNQSQKEKEMKDSKALYLIITKKADDKIIGFCHFRFDWDEEAIKGVVYCYELQIDVNYQSKGLGTWIMKILDSLGETFKLTKVMLTCLKHNHQAIKFYKEKCQFIIDSSSPSKFGQNTCYEILSRKIKLVD